MGELDRPWLGGLDEMAASFGGTTKATMSLRSTVRTMSTRTHHWVRGGWLPKEGFLQSHLALHQVERLAMVQVWDHVG